MSSPELPADWVPFHVRYGIGAHELGESQMATRHRHVPGYPNCETGPLRCRCPGGTGASSRCCMRATQEDTLCDVCREHCWAIDSKKVYHRLIDVYGPAT